MNNDFIAILDSGVGGLSVLRELTKIMPNERFLYFGDNSNAPYGNLSKNELLYITYNNIEYLKTFNIKALVIGCNTLSVTLLDKIREASGVATFGIFPPVESTVMKNGRTLLLSTCLTARAYHSNHVLEVVGLKDLAKDIEDNLDNLNRINLDKHFFGIKKDFNAVVLGCTHYFFIKKQIYDYFCPLKIYGGEVFTAKKVYNTLKNSKSLGNNKRLTIEFIGKFGAINKGFYEKSGQTC